MATTDYIIDSALVLMVLLQVRDRELTNRQLIRPVVILAVAVAIYFRGIPTAGNDLVLAAVLSIIGGAIGVASGITTIVRATDDGRVTVRSGWSSGFFWVLGMGSRFGFTYWITHGGIDGGWQVWLRLPLGQPADRLEA